MRTILILLVNIISVHAYASSVGEKRSLDEALYQNQDDAEAIGEIYDRSIDYNSENQKRAERQSGGDIQRIFKRDSPEIAKTSQKGGEIFGYSVEKYFELVLLFLSVLVTLQYLYTPVRGAFKFGLKTHSSIKILFLLLLLATEMMGLVYFFTNQFSLGQAVAFCSSILSLLHQLYILWMIKLLMPYALYQWRGIVAVALVVFIHFLTCTFLYIQAFKMYAESFKVNIN
jgi:hypothetical protein